MGSETTAAAAGKVGVVRRDPMAMLPFCGYNMGDYWQHWLDMGNYITNKPKIFNVNWFRTNDEGEFIWPGFGENMRVLEWILARCEDKVDAVECALGYLPKTEDICLDGTSVTQEDMAELLNVDKGLWRQELEEIKKFYSKIGDTVPAALAEELQKLESDLL
jgi:phosphoenolpyruvate carboxykinase (GTP)